MGTFGHLLLVKHLAELVDTDLDRFYHKLRTVVALQQESVQLRILLRHEEGFLRLPIMEVGEIHTAEVAILAAACNHHPTSVARP